MFGKLCKYEWKYMLRIFLPIWGAFLALGVVNRFTLWNMATSSRLGNALSGLLLLALVLGGLALGIASIVVIIQRFYNGLLKDEGYLMFTLPVKAGSLINAKGVTGVLLMFITGIVGLLVSLIVSSGGVDWPLLSSQVRDVFQAAILEMEIGAMDWVMMTLWGIAAVLIGLAGTIYQIYLSMALGHLAKKHRVACSVLALIGVSTVIQIVTWLVVWVADVDWLMDQVTKMAMLPSNLPKLVVETEIVCICYQGVFLLAFFFLTRYILQRRLNLE